MCYKSTTSQRRMCHTTGDSNTLTQPDEGTRVLLPLPLYRDSLALGGAWFALVSKKAKAEQALLRNARVTQLARH